MKRFYNFVDTLTKHGMTEKDGMTKKTKLN